VSTMRACTLVATMATAALIAVPYAAGESPAAPPAPASTALGDACALLTPAQVGAALGVKVTAGEHPVASHAYVCGWADPRVPLAHAKKALLVLLTPYQFELGQMTVPGVAKSVVTGVGDEAYSVVAGSVGTALNVRHGARYFQVKVGGAGLTDEQKQAIERKLAVEVLAR
jgi:hypothetical protein